MVDEKKLKKVQKEGGKRGVEIEGASDMGGLQFFCTSVEEPEGDLELLEESIKAMSAECKPDEEERKGGAGKVGKMVFSYNDQQLAIVCDVPEDKREQIKPADWMAKVCEVLGGEVVKSEDGLATGKVLQDKEKGKFPIKMKDEGINHSIAHLKSLGLFPDNADDSDDDYVFGDDDFPQVDSIPAAPKEPENDLSGYDDKKVKKVQKEGGKRGVEIEGASDMGGLQFFCTSVDEPEGDIILLEESIKAMSAECKPDEEERKGGAGKVGKMVFSYCDAQLSIVCDVPADKRDQIKAGDWMAKVCEILGGEVVKSGDALATGKVLQDKEKGKFPIKMKDEGINHSIAHLRSLGLFPDNADDSDDEMVFGDEDFPQ